MSQLPPDPVVALTPDPLTPRRNITHAHFQAGDTVVVLKGVASSELWGAMRIVAPSWHTPADEDGWRLCEAADVDLPEPLGAATDADRPTENPY